jgi:hypothetical protein
MDYKFGVPSDHDVLLCAPIFVEKERGNTSYGYVIASDNITVHRTRERFGFRVPVASMWPRLEVLVPYGLGVVGGGEGHLDGGVGPIRGVRQRPVHVAREPVHLDVAGPELRPPLRAGGQRLRGTRHMMPSDSTHGGSQPRVDEEQSGPGENVAGNSSTDAV